MCGKGGHKGQGLQQACERETHRNTHTHTQTYITHTHTHSERCLVYIRYI